MPFTYTRTVHFQDTDAAGVVYFANVLAMCHEAYEASLMATGIELRSFFSNPSVAVPIVHAEVDFFRPLVCGDRLLIHLTPQQLSSQTFEISYQILAEQASSPAAQARTRHVCIDPVSRTRKDLPTAIIQWLDQWRDAPP